MAEMTRLPFRVGTLRRGSIVRNKGSGDSYVVVQVSDGAALAIRTISVTNPDEWEVVPPEPGRPWWENGA